MGNPRAYRFRRGYPENQCWQDQQEADSGSVAVNRPNADEDWGQMKAFMVLSVIQILVLLMLTRTFGLVQLHPFLTLDLNMMKFNCFLQKFILKTYV